MRAVLIILAIVIGSNAFGQSVVLPAEIRGEPRDTIILVPDSLAKDAKINWRIDPGLIDETSKFEKIFGQKANGKFLKTNKAGRYRVEAWVTGDSMLPLDRASILTVLTDKTLSDAAKIDRAQSLLQGVSVCWVVIGDVPPDPDPEPMPPTDPLIAPVQAALTADTSATKIADVKILISVYLAAAEGIGAVVTANDAFKLIKGSTDARIESRLKPIRSIFGDELIKFMPLDQTAVLTKEQKDEASKQLNRFAKVLGGVK